MDDVARICARLLREGTVPRHELHELDHLDVRHEIEKRFESVGLVLSTSVYSQHVGLRLSPDVASDPAFDAATNLGLHADSCALLVILWARLVLQKRTAADTREVPGQGSLLPDVQAVAARQYQPQVRLTTLVREFGHVLGSKTHVKALVSQLRKLGFLGGAGETIEAGPLLELGLDGERMIGFIRRQVLADLLQRKVQGEAVSQTDDGSDELKVLNALQEREDGMGMTQLKQTTGLRVDRLRTILRDLMANGSVKRVGQGTHTRYEPVRA
ncbi:hypothetical protein [Candidatus Nitrospira bockiana]